MVFPALGRATKDAIGLDERDPKSSLRQARTGAEASNTTTNHHDVEKVSLALRHRKGRFVAKPVATRLERVHELAMNGTRLAPTRASAERERRTEECLQKISTRAHCHRCQAFS